MKKENEEMRSLIPVAFAECVDPAKFVLEVTSAVFPVEKRKEKSYNDLGWVCVLVLESLIVVVVDTVMGKSRLLATPTVKEKAEEIAETWKASLEERGGIENVKTPYVHTFLQHLVTFGIIKEEDVDLHRKLVVGLAWRKQMPNLAVSLGLADKMPSYTLNHKVMLNTCMAFLGLPLRRAIQTEAAYGAASLALNGAEHNRTSK